MHAWDNVHGFVEAERLNGAEDEPVTDDEDSCVGMASGDVGEELCGTPE